MKITKGQLRRLIREEIKEASFFGLGKKEAEVPNLQSSNPLNNATIYDNKSGGSIKVKTALANPTKYKHLMGAITKMIEKDPTGSATAKKLDNAKKIAKKAKEARAKIAAYEKANPEKAAAMKAERAKLAKEAEAKLRGMIPGIEKELGTPINRSIGIGDLLNIAIKTAIALPVLSHYAYNGVLRLAVEPSDLKGGGGSFGGGGSSDSW